MDQEIKDILKRIKKLKEDNECQHKLIQYLKKDLTDHNKRLKKLENITQKKYKKQTPNIKKIQKIDTNKQVLHTK